MKRPTKKELTQIIEKHFKIKVKKIEVDRTGMTLSLELTEFNIVILHSICYEITDFLRVDLESYIVKSVELRVRDSLMELIWT